MTILILGGTAEARAFAQTLVDRGRPVISSLAGRVSAPALPAGAVRIGGFGGPSGLQEFIVLQRISAVVDATHPFAARMSQHALIATTAVGCPLVRLDRPGWRGHQLAGQWTWVADTDEARAAAALAERPFLTTGRQSLANFLRWEDREVLVRVVDPPSFELPRRWQLIRSRGPYTYPAERQLMVDHATDVLVTKDSGGGHTSAKLDAATSLGIPIVIISRPAQLAGVASVATVAEALRWLEAVPYP